MISSIISMKQDKMAAIKNVLKNPGHTTQKTSVIKPSTKKIIDTMANKMSGNKNK